MYLDNFKILEDQLEKIKNHLDNNSGLGTGGAPIGIEDDRHSGIHHSFTNRKSIGGV